MTPRTKETGGGWTIGLVLLVAAGVAARLATLPLAPDMDDSILFKNGVVRFSIAEARPHWPGYPVFVWAGKLTNLLVHDPVRALHLVSALASAFTAVPLAFVARAWTLSLGVLPGRSARAGWAAAALWLATPMSWVTGSQIVSDPLGLLFGLSVLAVCVAAEGGRPGLWPVAAALGGLTAGVRLVNVTMLAPLLVAAFTHRRQRWRNVPMPVLLAIALALGVLSWAAWLVLRDPGAFVRGAQYHVGGHFGTWGDSVLTDPRRWDRPLRALRTLSVYGLGGGWPGLGWLRAAASLAWIATLATAARLHPWRGRVACLIAAWAVPHLAYVFLAHDVSFPRYLLSAVAVLALLGGLAAARPGRAAAAVVALTVILAAAVAGPVAARQRAQTPVESRVAAFLTGHPRAAIVVVDFLDLPLYLEDAGADITWVVATAADVEEWRARWAAEGRPVFSTAPPVEDASAWRPVAHFCRDALIDPRYGRDLWLFTPVAEAGAKLLEDCRE